MKNMKNGKWKIKKKLILLYSGFSTRAIHAGNNADPVHGGVVPSLDLSTTFAQPEPGVPSSCFDYARCGNPTVLAL